MHSYMQYFRRVLCNSNRDYWYNDHYCDWYEWYSDSYCNFQFDRCCYDLRVHSSGYSSQSLNHPGWCCWHLDSQRYFDCGRCCTRDIPVVFTPNPPTCPPTCSVSAAFSATATATTGTTTITVTGTSGTTTAT